MSGIYGADVSTPVSVAQWQSLMAQNSVSFGIVRCYQSNGVVDPNAPSSVNHAWAAGLSNVSVYHFPCLSVGAAAQVQASVQALNAANAKFDMYWIDVETGAGWSTTNFQSNAAFLSQLIQAAEALGLTVGIYTSVYEWSQVMGPLGGFSQYPLWYANYDSQASFADFIAFAGWTSPLMKQFMGDQTTAGVGFDGNWAPSPLPTSPTSSSAPTSATAAASS